MPETKGRCVLLATLVAAACGGRGDATPPPPSPRPSMTGEVAVSGLTPFAAGCSGVESAAYIHAEAEPHLGVSPANPDHLVAVWQQDRFSNGAARGLMTAVSLDGGATWSHRQVPFSRCSGGSGALGTDFLRATDPWVSFSPDGTAHQAALSLSGAIFTDSGSDALFASRSLESLGRWSNPVALNRSARALFDDKETITADPFEARFVYAAWDRIRDNTSTVMHFARTSDGGASWEPATPIFAPTAPEWTIGPIVLVLPGGTLVNVFTLADEPAPGIATLSVQAMRSTDRGSTWSAPMTVAAMSPVGARDLATGRKVRDGSVLVQAAAGPDGTLHVVWQDSRFSADAASRGDGIAYVRSGDGGLTWSAPVRVSPEASRFAFTPQVHVRSDGVIGVTYYDLRSNTVDVSTLPADYWLARSADAVNWTETRVAPTFDLDTAPLASGDFFLGDYMGLASAGTRFLPLYVRTTGNRDNPTDVFIARAVPSGAAEGAPGPKRIPESGALRYRAAPLAVAEPDETTRRLVSENVLRWKAGRLRGRPPAD